MAIISDLVTICAEHRLDGAPTLTVFSRELREAGRLSQAGRGRGAAKATFLDGARFLIACAATDHPKRAVDAESVFSNTLFESGTERLSRSETTFVRPEDAEPTLDLALAKVLSAIADGSLDQSEKDRAQAEGHTFRLDTMLSLDVFRSGVSVVLRAGSTDLNYGHPAKLQMVAAKHSDTMLALAEAWERETERFRSGKNLHATLDAPLLRAVAYAIGGTPAIVERQTDITAPGASAPGQNEETR